LPIQSFRQITKKLGCMAQVSILGRESAELLTVPRQLLVVHFLPRSTPVASGRVAESVKEIIGNDLSTDPCRADRSRSIPVWTAAARGLSPQARAQIAKL
jgi:hypothetical protein